MSTTYKVEADFLAAWLAARSIARGAPQPVPEYGGLRVDTGRAATPRRYFFAGPVAGIQELAQAVHTPGVFIRMCGSGRELRALVPPRWTLEPGAYLMTRDAGRNPVPSLPSGYRLQLTTQFPLTTARIFAEDDSLVASGQAAEYGGIFIFDRITTVPAHQHHGLGAALVAALGTAQQSQAVHRVLIANEAGRALYSTLGWTARSHYATVTIKPLS